MPRNGVEVCCSDDTLASFGGTVYAPRSFIDLHNHDSPGPVVIAIDSVVALGISWTGGGNGGTTIGIPPPNPLSLDTRSLPAWTVNRAYPTTTLAVSGGTAGYLWSATGLPTNLSINQRTGVISGTPTTANTYTVDVTVGDSIGESDTKTYSLRINPIPVDQRPGVVEELDHQPRLPRDGDDGNGGNDAVRMVGIRIADRAHDQLDHRRDHGDAERARHVQPDHHAHRRERRDRHARTTR